MLSNVHKVINWQNQMYELCDARNQAECHTELWHDNTTLDLIWGLERIICGGGPGPGPGDQCGWLVAVAQCWCWLLRHFIRIGGSSQAQHPAAAGYITPATTEKTRILAMVSYFNSQLTLTFRTMHFKCRSIKYKASQLKFRHWRWLLCCK